ncbi:MAG TPA: FtsW/RodA/SpoVE family cell cycle protein [Pseudogracilibacillus sp.]|nr:FtsW/RodA/SpoVE family cell cycle protein [Pseudogracilibacillus sp.]
MLTWKGYDYTLILVPIFLSAFGLLMIYSASMVSTTLDGLDSTYYLFKQLKWFVLGIIGFVFCCIFPYQNYKRVVKPMILLSIGLLLFTIFFGDTVNRATRSVDIFGFNIQPSEFVKLFLIIYLAAIYSKKQKYIGNFLYGALPPLVMTIVMVGLIVLQPDLGTAVIILLIVSTIILSSGIKMKHILFLFSCCLLILLVLIPKLITDSRIARFTGAFHPFENPDGDGYHLIQSYLAIGGGGVSGEGLGQSIQKLGYLWGAHTDFIMAVVSEELGIFGVVLVIALFLLIILRGLHIAKECPDSFGSLLAIGISSMVAIQAIINLGAISGLLPITGVPLPFISYGGSSLFILLIAMGILNNIARSVHVTEEEPRVIESTPIYQNKERRGTTWPN